jgi:hypothetical protein
LDRYRHILAFAGVRLTLPSPAIGELEARSVE